MSALLIINKTMKVEQNIMMNHNKDIFLKIII